MKSVVKAKWIIKIGSKAKIKCKVGDLLKMGDVVMEEGNDVLKSYDASIVLSRVGKDKIESINNSLKEKKICAGDIICETGGISSKKIFAPIGGTFVGIDEFFNMTIKEETIDKKIIKAPVDCRVGEINKEKVVLEFGAYEIKGKGIILGRVWGDADFKVIEQLSELDYKCEGKIILTENIESTFLTKAEVVGVVGLIVKEEKELEADIPILWVENADWEKLVSMGEKNILYRVLLNAKLERLLIAKTK